MIIVIHLIGENMSLIDAIGKTPLIEIPSLSKATKCRILLKCEHLNPGGSIKDRAAKSMILKARSRGELRPGMTIVEGTAGNTGIGLALVGRALGHSVTVVMPNNQSKEKERLIEFFGASLILVPACPFADQNHFYHTAKKIAAQNSDKYWWANQFENLDNHLAHYEETAPEIWSQAEGQIDYLVSSAGTGGTIAGCSKFLKEKNLHLKTILVDPDGSGLANFVRHGEFKSTGSSITEGIGIMRLVANFKEAKVDEAMNFNDQELVNMAYHLREHDALVLGSSSVLNVLGAYQLAKNCGPGKTIVTFCCDSGERNISRLYNPEFLSSNGLIIGKIL
jgi:cysteine synthase A